jgi:hypothetical protein
MTPALVGLLGVVAGALLGGIVTIEVDRGRRRRLAIAAAHRVRIELEKAERTFNAARRTGLWWLGDVSEDAWRAHSDNLVAALRPDVLKAVQNAYVLIETWSAEWAHRHQLALMRYEAVAQNYPDKAVWHSPTIEKAKLEELRKDACALGSARSRLAGDTTRLQGSSAWVPIKRVLRWGAYGALVVIAICGVTALTIDRPYLTDVTVADELESKLGGNTRVDCDGSKGDWSCVVYELNAAGEDRAASPLALTPATAAAAPILIPWASSSAAATVKRFDAVAVGGAELVYTEKLTPEQILREESREVITTQGAKKSLLLRLWDGVWARFTAPIS